MLLSSLAINGTFTYFALKWAETFHTVAIFFDPRIAMRSKRRRKIQCFILFTQYYFYNITLFYKHIYVRLAVELTRRLLFNRKTLKVSVLSNLRYVFYNILIYSDIYMLCMLNGPELFSQTAFPLVLTERRLIVRFSLIYICILLRYIIL